MYLTGFADEASTSLEGQIKATQELGWNHIESRCIDGVNLHDISDEQFEEVYKNLSEANIQINCFGAAIANWGKQITDGPKLSLEESKRAIPRMKKLGSKYIRIMSFAILKDKEPKDQMLDERVNYLSDIIKLFTDEGLTPVHENCSNFGGMGWEQTLELVDRLPGLRLVYDTGNPVFNLDYTKPEPRPMQSSWEFYKNVKQHIEYVHIKDGIFDQEKESTKFTFAGEGDGDVKAIVKDLLDNGYDGGFSMEPHLAVVFHDDSVKAEESVKYENYVEFGKRFMDLLEEVGHGDKVTCAK
ncbi:MAG: xylose isomerase [Planctomycetota bacterium]|nr:MAG: xylose isomerase [Planctomycetota bacterium]